MASSRILNKRHRRLWLGMVTLLLTMTAQADSWALKKADPTRDIRAYQRPHPGSDFDDVYAVTTLDGRPARIVAILTDASAMPEWVARVAQAKVISRKPNDAIIYLRYALPYPFRPRDAVLRSRRTNEADAIIIEAEAIVDTYPMQANVVRMQGAKSRWRVSAVDAQRVKVELWGSGEPGGFIPAVLYNYNLADDAVQTLKQLRRMALREKYQRAELTADVQN